MRGPMTEKASAGFTLVELLITVMLSSIIFAGLAAMYGQSFRTQIESTREEWLQSAATMSLMKLQRDFKEATYIDFPAPGGSSNQYLYGRKGHVYTGPNAGNFSAVPPGATPTEFYYVVCTDKRMVYYESNAMGGGPPSATCPPAWGTITPILLVPNPILLEQTGATSIFQRTANAQDPRFSDVTVTFTVAYPSNVYGIYVTSMNVTTQLPVNAAFVHP